MSTRTHSAPEVGDGPATSIHAGAYNKHQPDWEYATASKRTLLDGIKDAGTKLVPARLAPEKARNGEHQPARTRRRRTDQTRPQPLWAGGRQIGVIRLERAPRRIRSWVKLPTT